MRGSTVPLSRLPEYRHWINMISRCEYDHPQYEASYQSRGISVCLRWRSSFAAFLDDVGRRPSPNHSLDRIDNDRGYEPGNVRWATQTEQMRNVRYNRIVDAFGQRMTLAEAVERSGLRYNTVLYRLKRKWPLDLALATPCQRGRPPTRRVDDAA